MATSALNGGNPQFFLLRDSCRSASYNSLTWRLNRSPKSSFKSSPDYSRSAAYSPYHVACKQVVFHPLRGTVFSQVDDHAIRKLMDVPPLLPTLGQRHATVE